MKLLLFCYLSFLPLLSAVELPSSPKELALERYQKSVAKKASIVDHLAQVKLEILRGNLSQAKKLLMQVDYAPENVRPILYRYLGIIDFLEGDYESAIRTLQKKELNTDSNYPHICHLKTLNLFMSNKLDLAKREWKKCKVYTSNDATRANKWLESFLSSHDYSSARLNYLLMQGRSEDAKLFLKTILFLEQFKPIIPMIKKFDSNSIEDAQLREMLAFVLFRAGEIKAAYQYMQGLDTSNIHTMEGNFYLLQGSLQEAFAKFKLAYLKKPTSTNALERLVPLSWLLRQWSDGTSYLQSIDSPDPVYATMLGALYHRANEDKLALESLLWLQKNKKLPIRGHKMLALLQLKKSQFEQARDNLEHACEGEDLISCIYLFHLGEDLDLVAQDLSEEKMNRLDPPLADEDLTPLSLEKYVDQSYIEELDLKQKKF